MEIGPTTRFMERVLDQFKIPNMIFGGDINSHNTTWGYHTTDQKGRELEDFICSKNLVLHNTAKAPPTFDSVYAQGWPDLILTTMHVAPLLQDWQVDDQESLSDHKFITFSLSQTTSVTKIKRYNLPGRKLLSFTKKIKMHLTNLEATLQQAVTLPELEDFSLKLQDTLQTVCNQNLPSRKPQRVQEISWWTGALRTQQRKCRALRRRLKYERRLEIPSTTLPIFQRERAKYKKMIIQAKVTSWREYCTHTKEIYGLHHKIATGKVFKPSQLQIPHSQCSNEDYTADTLNAVLNTVFSQDDAAQDTAQ
ncbi:uncharacterized protein LOC118189455 [Stegodyphus dumicola]|uniref:uncharacterized protein LOC118189455 n=1 Tax=Stegodyphus dumicola TaxID=202533 RepID=UPI0015AA76BC|nr:uncharacterized protein LOC118189455 [Stegodyphus dumicola]